MVSRKSELSTMQAYFDALLNETAFEPPEQTKEYQQPDTKDKIASLNNAIPARELQPLQELLDVVPEPQQEVQVLPNQELDITHLPSLIPQSEVLPDKAAEIEELEERSDVAEIDLTALSESIDSNSDSWENISTEQEFQALFFVVAGVTFAVPLSELGGIHRLGDITPLFGKPDWYTGIMLHREDKLNIVDTAKWIMPGNELEPKYGFTIMLGTTNWGLTAETLIGTERLRREDILWRKESGRRPWLAGMVREKMCALLHVSELVKLLELGLNMDDC